jgi:hypothetical protein
MVITKMVFIPMDDIAYAEPTRVCQPYKIRTSRLRKGIVGMPIEGESSIP